MPISASQHRILTGNYQNQNYTNTNSSIVHTFKTKSNCLTLSDEIHHFTSKIACIHNTPKVLNTQPNQHNTPQNAIALTMQFMLLLSQIKNPDYPILDTNHDLQFMSDKKTLSPAPDYALQPTVDNRRLNAIWNPVVNAFNEIDKFISQYDPLQFPRADATPLYTTAHLPNNFVNTMNDLNMEIIAHNLNKLKCIDKNKYESFRVTVFNAVKLLTSSIQQLKSKNNEIDHHLKYYGFVDINTAKKRLILLYKTMKSEIKNIFKCNKDSIYYGYSRISEIETKKIASLVITTDKKRRILLTDTFFELCTVHAARLLIHEISHFHFKGDFFYIEPEKSCLINRDKASEIDIRSQLDDASDFYVHSIKKLTENNIYEDKMISHIYGISKKEFLETFNTNKTFREEALFINADSISYLAIALGNYGFKKNNIMPLNDISKFKTGELIES